MIALQIVALFCCLGSVAALWAGQPGSSLAWSLQCWVIVFILIVGQEKVSKEINTPTFVPIVQMQDDLLLVDE